MASRSDCWDIGLKHRAVLCEDLFIIGKGAHTPHCDPASLTSQLLQSLERMQTDHVDIYLMHRDNPAIAASEFLDVLNEHWNAGRIRAFGGSNRVVARVQKANNYAKGRGLQGFKTVSNNFSLARMVDPAWDGCVSASDKASRG